MKVIEFVLTEKKMSFKQNLETVVLTKHDAHEHKFTKLPIDAKYFAHTIFGEVEIGENSHAVINSFMVSEILNDEISVIENKTPDYIFKGYATQEELDAETKKIEDERAKQMAERQAALLKGSNSKPKKKAVKKSKSKK